jgi:hypothetical protein
MAARPRRSHLRVREEEDVVAEARHRLEDVCLKGLGTRQQKRQTALRGSRCFTSSGATLRRTRAVLPGAGDSTSASMLRMPGMKRLSQAHHVYSVRPTTLNRCGISRTARPPKPMIRPSLSM